MTTRPASDIAFTPAVKAIQTRKGSRAAYARMEAGGGWQTRITPDLTAFIAAQTSIFFGTANAAGQPYIQHRGGPLRWHFGHHSLHEIAEFLRYAEN